MSSGPRFFGKYRGTVINNVDPQMQGRIQVQLADHYGMFPSTWALPAFPFAGKGAAIVALPQVASSVWVEFEAGDPDYPIWTGCYYGSAADVPALALAGNPASPSILLQTTAQNTFVISDLPGPTGGIMLKSTSGATLIVNDTGIYIQNGKGASLVLTGPSVTLNNGALSVV